MSKFVSKTSLIILIIMALCGSAFASGWYASSVMAPPPTTISTTGTANVGGLVSSGWINSTNTKFTNDFYWGSVNRTDVLAYPEQVESYTVWANGGVYYAKNGHTGVIDFSGVTASTVIQATLGALTGGRTWKEKVVFKGIFTILVQINVPSYTILEGGRFEAGANMASIFDITDVHDVDIGKYMIIDGNYPAFTARGVNAFGTTTEKIKVENVFIQDAYPNYISIRGTNLEVNDNYLIDTTSAVGDVVGIYVGIPEQEYNTGRRSKNIIVSRNQIYNIYGDGLSINNCKAIVAENFIDGHSRGLSTAGGIDIWGICDGSTVSLNKIIDKDAGAAAISCGIVIWRAAGVTPNLVADKVSIHDNIVSGSGSSGIAVYSAPGNVHSNISIIGNIIFGTLLQWASGGDITLYYCNDSVVMENELYSATPLWLEGIGGVNIIKNNKGYVTENSGSTTILNSTTTKWFTHGCSYTPIATDTTFTMTNNPTFDPGSVYFIASNATKIEVGCLRDPGASGLNLSWSVRRTP